MRRERQERTREERRTYSGKKGDGESMRDDAPADRAAEADDTRTSEAQPFRKEVSGSSFYRISEISGIAVAGSCQSYRTWRNWLPRSTHPRGTDRVLLEKPGKGGGCASSLFTC